MFELVVTDNESAIGKDTVTIYVDPSPVIISEYIEGTSGTNKYLEIYNASDALIDLSSAGYELRLASNGSGAFSTAKFSDWGASSGLAAGATIVLADTGATLYPSPTIITAGVMSFNGNDAIGLFRNGLLVDVVGNPSSAVDLVKDMDLRRKSTFLSGNSTYDSDEWDSYDATNVSNLGFHNINPNVPVISAITVTPEFITSADEISVSATLTAVVGSIASAKIHYGAAGSLINETAMWQESGNLWMGAIPAQT